MHQTKLARRTFLTAAAAAPLAAATSVKAAAPMLGAAVTPFNRFRVGAFEVTTLLVDSRTVEGPQQIFGMNVSPEEFAEVSAAANLPTDKAKFFFTPTLVNTGSELVLFDTGLNGAGMAAAVTAAGYAPDQIDVVVITHMHPDHIGGLMTDGSPTFTNARYITGRVEFDTWAKAGNEGFEALMRPLGDQTTMLEGGQDVVSGITSVPAFGHTPGHMTYMIESDGQQLLIAADFANHYVWSLAHPDWEVKFDMDKAAAAATRRSLLDMMAADKVPFVGYHMPWPGVGYVLAHGNSYVYVPESYQLQL
ncbi:N-acyl homoserine lactonase [Roseovarius albus]|uniref:N-acyl homoserine lactonase n=1 Tax=Roseovarius albus TaxID=1247867 RepID=A0A1X6YHH0_9RHOB|nr:MBL fold metallo-hydrolase [Roseovarius albus]SLN21041.1 N-acyl homoserine lactonase [Roseovarius albus]